MIYISWTQFDSQSYLTTIVVLKNSKMVHTHPVTLQFYLYIVQLVVMATF